MHKSPMRHAERRSGCPPTQSSQNKPRTQLDLWTNVMVGFPVEKSPSHQKLPGKRRQSRQRFPFETQLGRGKMGYHKPRVKAVQNRSNSLLKNLIRNHFSASFCDFRSVRKQAKGRFWS